MAALSAEEMLVAVLTGDPATVALVEDRVTPRPAGEAGGLPCVTYTRAASERFYAQTGYANLAIPDLYVSCWDATYTGAKQLARAVEDALHGASFRIASDTDGYDQEGKAHRVLFVVNVAEGR